MKEFIGGIVSAIGLWIIVIPAREALTNYYGNQNPYILGIILLVAGLWLGGKNLR